MKNIISVGFQIPGYSDNYISFRSNKSLLDADIVIFSPDISIYKTDTWNSTYQGKRSLSENASFDLITDSKHWKNEILYLLNEGKNVFIIFSDYEEVFIYTGQKTFSGTGRNQKTTNMVTLTNNYTFLPVLLPAIIPKSGNEIKYLGHPIFATFWNEFKEYLSFGSYLDGDISEPLFSTKNANKPVGGIFKVKKGNLILLPNIVYDQDEFTTYKGDKSYWNKKGLVFGNRLVALIVDIDKSLCSINEITPPPDWVNSEEYKLQIEDKIEKEINEIHNQIECLTNSKSQLYIDLQNEKLIKGLVYEKGKPLENAIILALKYLGYQAENYDDGIDEFDQIIISPEGNRFIGEAEGKDKSAINIDKFRQLEGNIQQDFSKDNVSQPAIGILFGNGFRLTPPENREIQFTEKCLKNAERLNVILVQTMDLFKIIRYIKSNDNEKFKQECRNAIISSRGKVVKFPTIPQ